VKKSFKMALVCAFFSIFFARFAPALESRGPKMVLDELNFNSGEVREGNVVSHAFRVFNQGDQPLEIRKVKPG
jgi:hypothetical protein